MPGRHRVGTGEGRTPRRSQCPREAQRDGLPERRRILPTHSRMSVFRVPSPFIDPGASSNLPYRALPVRTPIPRPGSAARMAPRWSHDATDDTRALRLRRRLHQHERRAVRSQGMWNFAGRCRGRRDYAGPSTGSCGWGLDVAPPGPPPAPNPPWCRPPTKVAPRPLRRPRWSSHYRR